MGRQIVLPQWKGIYFVVFPQPERYNRHYKQSAVDRLLFVQYRLCHYSVQLLETYRKCIGYVQQHCDKNRNTDFYSGGTTLQ